MKAKSSISNKLGIVAILLFSSVLNLIAQGSAGSAAKYESRYCVDMPTAGILTGGAFVCSGQFFDNGGAMFEFQTGPFKTGFFRNLNFGISYGGTKIISDASPDMQKYPGIFLKYRIIDEKLTFPAIAIGYNSQGRGAWISSPGRYEQQSPGLFAAVSKNFKNDIGDLALHGGINYSFDPNPSDRKPNIYLGLEQALGSRFAVCAEYNAKLDASSDKYGKFNTALRFSAAPGLTLEIQFRNLIQSDSDIKTGLRYFGFEYIGKF